MNVAASSPRARFLRRLAIVALALPFARLACPGAAVAEDRVDIWPTEGWETSSPEAQGMTSRDLADLVTFGISNGMHSLLVTRHGKIVAEAYYAPFTSGLKHRINSATKSVIGSLVAVALKEGLQKSLDQPVLDFFPDRTFANVDERKKALTLRNLLDMTSGLEWSEPLSNAVPASMFAMERSRDWLQVILDQRMMREPGATFDYNSGNPHVLSAILSKVTGRKHARLHKGQALRAARHRGRAVASRPARSLDRRIRPLSAAARMAKLGHLWLRGGAWEGRQLLPPEWLDKARRATVAVGLGPDLRYGNLFWSPPTKDVYAAVGFHRQLIVVMPGLDVVAVFTGAARYSNASGAPSSPSYSFEAVLGRLKAVVKSDAALVEDPAGSAALTDAVKRVAQEARTQESESSPLASEISGKVNRMKPNELRLRSFSLAFDDGAASYAYAVDGERMGGPIGLDGLYRVGGRRLYGPNAAKGRWLDDETFQLELQTVGNDDAAIAEATFVGNDVGIRLDTLGGLTFSLTGERDK
jgi:CubicO group peptidase (beta-lactamase class C family)